MPIIPNETIEQILDKTDIVEVLSGHMPLRKAGHNFKANCPFHEEKTPSFVVSPAKQIYHCFGCGAGGNVISFLMKYERCLPRRQASRCRGRTGMRRQKCLLRKNYTKSITRHAVFMEKTSKPRRVKRLGGILLRGALTRGR